MNPAPIVGLVTVRTSSTRLPGKCLLPFGDGNVLHHVVRRARAFGIEPIVCTSVNPTDDVIAELMDREGVECFRGSLVNKLRRWSDCAAHYHLKSFHTVDADDPFFDADQIRRSMSMLHEEQLDMVKPTAASSAGGASVGFSLTSNIVARSVRGLSENEDTEMMWYHLEKIPDLRSAVLPETVPNRPRVRLTLDFPEDYWLLESVRRMVGGLASREGVEKLFYRNPDLYKINWFRTEEWKAGQASKQT